VLRRIVRDAFFPGQGRVPDPRAGLGIPGLERWERPIGDGFVEAWFVPAREAAEAPAGAARRPTVVFAHGNAELIDDWADALAPLRGIGVNVLLPEYRGYGRSGGEASETSITEDYVSFCRRLRERPDVDPERIVYVGRSLGGGVVCSLMERIPPRALVLMSTFTSARAMARRYLVPGMFVPDRFDSLGAVSRSRLPIWVIHGTRDDLIPPSHGRALAAAANAAKLTLYDAGHNDCPPDWAVFYRELVDFLREAAVLPGGAG
jgi:uncharacterized protein